MAEIIIGTLIAGIFSLIGIISQIVGNFYSDKLIHKRNLIKLKENHKYQLIYLREKEFFKNKLNYFERISKKIEEICYDYTQIINFSPKKLEIIAKMYNQKINQTKIKNIEKKFSAIKNRISKEEELTFFLPKGASLYLTKTKIAPLLNSFILTHVKIIADIQKIKIEKISEEILKIVEENFQTGQQLINNLAEEINNLK